jgi:hypothetical protein
MALARSDLYKLIWSKPMTHVAAQLQVSDSYLARVCKSLRVPRPPRGYWAKLAVGKAPAVVPLPESAPGQLLEWSKGAVLPPELPAAMPRIDVRQRSASRGKVKENGASASTHPLIQGARKNFENTRTVQDDGYLRPYKKHLVDITTSNASLARALSLANDIFNALQRAGHYVLLAQQGRINRGDLGTREVSSRRPEPYYHSTQWRPTLPTVVIVEEVMIGLAFIEMSEEVVMRYVNGSYVRESDHKPARRLGFADSTWTTTRDVPSGRFRLVMYSPHPLVSWSTSFQESAGSAFARQIPAIVAATRAMAVDQKERIAKAEEERARWRAEMEAEEERQARRTDLEEKRASETASIRELEEIIQTWSRHRNLEAFFDLVEAAAAELPTVQREHVSARLKMARDSIGVIEPLQCLLEWKTPTERYQPRYSHLSEEDPEEEEPSIVED